MSPATSTITLTRSPLAMLLVACLLVAHFGPALMMPPTMLRTVCGVAADAEEAMEYKAMLAGKAVGEMVMKPIAIVGGLKAAAVGAGMKASGATIRFVGNKMVKDGSILEATGSGVKGAGLGVAAMAVKPAAEKIVAASQAAEGSIKTASDLVKSVGDTSIQIDARIDSPIIGHHHKNVAVSAGLDTAANQVRGAESKLVEQQPHQQVEEQVAHQAEEKSRTKRAAKIDPEVMRSALSLVKEAKMEDCVARAICDLNCNPQGFGQDGKQVFMTMVRLQGTNLLDQTESNYFREAATKGRSYSGKCDQCAEHYKKCTSKSSDLIKMASHIRMD